MPPSRLRKFFGTATGYRKISAIIRNAVERRRTRVAAAKSRPNAMLREKANQIKKINRQMKGAGLKKEPEIRRREDPESWETSGTKEWRI